MNNLKKVFLLFILIFLLSFLFRYNYILSKSIIDATYLWLEKVFPTLFIMFVLNDLIIKTNMLSFLTNFISPIFNKIFHTSHLSFEAFFLSLFSGTPSSAFILKEMTSQKKINLNDANKLIAYTFFPNPLFLYTILNLSFNKIITLKIILTIYLSNLIIGIFLRGKEIKQEEINLNSYSPASNIFLILPSSITKSINTLFMILGSIAFYMIITNLILKIYPFNPISSVFLKGFLEMTQALNSLPLLNILSFKKEIIAIIIISFGGFSIHTQILQLLEGTNIKYSNFLKGRLLHVIISTSSYILIKIFFTS